MSGSKRTAEKPDERPLREAKPRLTRRALLASAASGVGAAVLGNVARGQDDVASAVPRKHYSPEDTTKLLGPPPSELGRRAPYEQPQRWVSRREPSGSSQTPLQDLDGIITPADLHFERHHGGIPDVDPERYQLLIHGMVDKPKVFTLADLERFPSRSRISFIECSGNGSRAFREIEKDLTPQEIDGLTSTSEWTGVPLGLLFREVGAKDRATWFLAEGQDAAVMTRSIPVSKAWDDAMIVYAQNGEPLRPEQGYPARLLLPGWEGNAQVKWIRRIELADRPFMTREETSKYTDPLADCTARMFSFVMDAKSTITFPTYPTTLPDKGWWEVTGIAWSGRGRITRVEVTADGGRTWQDAELQEPVLPKCHTRFRFMWNWNGREALLMSRATDETGYRQPTRKELARARGEGTQYHFNHIRAWRVRRDGSVVFGL
jgi:sulfane dehydrogenase subunit SoxC